ncbi:MAG: PKD domain-containing protein [Planctomycetota bacterium]
MEAGADVVTWLEAGTRVGNLDATVTDDDAYTVQWTVVSEPSAGAAVIDTATAEDTGVTLTAVGEYVLQLEASDGEYTGSDTVTINVYNDSCEAAQSLPDYEPLVGDINGDCKVDDVDMALLQENLGKDNSLTDDWFKVD